MHWGSFFELEAHVVNQLFIVLPVDCIWSHFARGGEASHRVKDRASLCQLPIPEPKIFSNISSFNQIPFYIWGALPLRGVMWPQKHSHQRRDSRRKTHKLPKTNPKLFESPQVLSSPDAARGWDIFYSVIIQWEKPSFQDPLWNKSLFFSRS